MRVRIVTLFAAPLLAAISPCSAEFRLSAEDVVAVDAVGAPEISGRRYAVDPSGEVRLPLVGAVRAEGSTPAELEKAIADRLRVYVREPRVTVSVAETGKRPVAVMGAVNAPGAHPIRGPKTLSEVLSLAGGPTGEAGPFLTLTRRREFGAPALPGARLDASERFWVARVELGALLDGRAPEQDIAVEPHDIVNVPRAEQAYVIGAVARPGAFALRAGGGATVLQALAEAGGLGRHALPRQARILSPDGAGGRRERPVDLKAVLTGRGADVTLAAEDVLFVPASGGRAAAEQIGRAALTIGTGAAIWVAAR